MHLTRTQICLVASRFLRLIVLMVAAGGAGFASGAPYVEFDFPRSVVCRDVTPSEKVEQFSRARLIELTLPMSVRFHGLSSQEVEEIDIEINGAATGMRVYDFSPATQLATDVAQPIETITTTKKARSLDATLGGELPIPFGETVAHATPSLNAGISGSETATEKLNRLPPKHAVVVSGTSSEGRGVFFKLKRSTQTSLEGVHFLAVTFLVPAEWRSGEVRVGCSARGSRKMLWLKQSATLGGAAGTVKLYAAGAAPAYSVAKPVIADAERNVTPTSFLTAAAASVVEIFEGPIRSKPADDASHQDSDEETADHSLWRTRTAISSESAR